MFKLQTKKWQDFLKSLAAALHCQIGVIDTESGECNSFGCDLLKEHSGVHSRHCLPFWAETALEASGEVKFKTCPMGFNLPFIKLNGQPLVVFICCKTNYPDFYSEAVLNLFDEVESWKEILNNINEGTAQKEESLISKVKTAGQLLELYALTIYGFNKYGADSLNLAVVREINNLICTLINEDRFDIMKVIDLVLGFIIIVADVEGSWAVIKLINGRTAVLLKGGTPCFSEFLAAQNFCPDNFAGVEVSEEVFQSSIFEKYKCGSYEKILNKHSFWGWVGVENPKGPNSGRLSLFVRPLEIALEIYKLHYYVSRQLGTVFLNSLPAGILLLNMDGRIFYSNKVAEQLTELNKEALCSNTLEGIFGLKFPNLVTGGAKKSFEPLFQYQFTEKGRYFSYNHIKVLNENDMAAGSVFIFTDKTEEEALKLEIQKLDRANIASQLAASVAHEVRNPLSAAKGFLQLIMQKSSDLKILNYAGIVLSELENINKIITDFLNLARPAEPQKIRVDLKDLLHSVKNIIQSEAIMFNIKFDLLFEKESFPEIFLDPNQIKQVILNLAKNSIQSVKDGGELVISASMREGNAVIKVRDTGEGIPPVVLKNIFKPFFTTKETGTGMGLSVCKTIVEAHGGKIAVNTAFPGGGTEFEVVLPVETPFQESLKP